MKLYQDLVHSIGGIVWEIDAKDFGFTYVSPQCERLLGYSPERWLKEVTWKSLIHPEDLNRVLAICGKAVEEGRDHILEYRVIAADGRVVWTKDVATVIFEDGRPAKVRGVLLDVTRQKQAEMALLDSAGRFRSMAESSPDAVVCADGCGCVVAWNRAAREMFGYAEDEVIGKPLTSLMPEGYREAHQGGMARFLTTGEKRVLGRTVELQGQKKDGTIFPIELSLSAWNTQNGPFFGAIVRDITTRRRAETLLAGTNRVLEALALGKPLLEVLTPLVHLLEEQFPGVRCSVMEVDRDGRRLRALAAPSFPEEFGRAVDGLAIGPCAGACGTAAHRRETVIVEDVETDPLWAGFRDLARGHEIRACWSRPVLSADGQALGTLCMYYREPRRPHGREEEMMDTAARLVKIAIERKRAQEEMEAIHGQLAQSEKMAAIGQLAGGIAHELNNPLQAIIAYATLLRQKVEGMNAGAVRTEEERKASLKMVSAVAEAAQRSAKIVKNLLAFARKDAQQKTTVNIGELLRTTVEFLGHTLSFRNVQVRVDVAADLPPIRGNPVALQQVFTNLLLNAGDAMVSGGTVTLEARRVDGSIEIAVADAGVGIPPENLKRIFEPFFTTKPPGKGTGLGLSVTYGIVREHGGAIDVESAVGKGSVFRVKIPAVAESPAAALSPLDEAGRAAP